MTNKESATDSDQEIRRLYEEGLSEEAIAERMSMPTAVIGAWVDRETDGADNDSSESETEDSDATDEDDSHGGVDWSRAT